jgi:hypothetical protein
MMPLPVRVDVDNLLLLAAAFMALKQWWAHRRLVENMKVNEVSYQIAERQIRHRLAVGVLLFVLAIAIPLGDQLDFFFRARPGVFFAYWMGVLLLVFAMVVIALGDILSTLAAARLSQVDLRRERQELEEEIRRFRAQSKSVDEKHDES